MKIRALLLAALLSSATSAFAATKVEPGFNLFSSQQDVQIGQASAAQIERQLPLLSSPRAAQFVQRVGQRLAAQAPGPKFTYRFKVVNASDMNAFALPGGYVYVNRGLVERVKTEGQLAGVLAHEIAHVALRHPTQQMSKAYAARAGAGVVLGLLGQGSGTSTRNVVNTVGGVGLNTLFLKFSRTAERDADVLGVQVLSRAGYDPREMADFFTLMRKEQGRDPGKVATFFSSHPATADRLTRVRAEAASLASTPRRAPVGGLTVAQSELRALSPAPPLAQLVSRSPARTLR